MVFVVPQYSSQQKLDYGRVKTLVAIENPIVRRGVLGVLSQFGFRNIVELANYVGVHKYLKENQVDLVISNTHFSDLSIAQIAKEMRDDLQSENAFSTVILLTSNRDHDFLRGVIDCGADDLLLMPISPQNLVDRVRLFSARRKPFVVTFNYIGPDRRKQPRAGSESAPLVEVPNLLRARALQQDQAAVQAEVDAALQRLNTLRIQRDGVQLRWLEDALRKLLHAGRFGAPQFGEYLGDLGRTANDLKFRTAKWTNNRVPGLAEEVIGLVRETEGKNAPVDFGKVDRLLDFCGKIAAEISRALPSTARDLPPAPAAAAAGMSL